MVCKLQNMELKFITMEQLAQDESSLEASLFKESVQGTSL